MDPRPNAPIARRLILPLAALALLALASIVAAPAGAPPAPEAVPPAGSAPDPDWRPREPMDGARIALALRRLRVLTSALYVAAHPDDENTALLTYLTQGRLARAGYLSMTRGDGGQNLIGDEIGEQLGLIRTQELLAARALDGAEQFFTRAVDFGYSKTPEETLEFWGRDSILADVVWVIRAFRPDVIFTRFPIDGRGGHGHHTASAQLAEAAFEAAGDPARFPEQLRHVKPWRPRRLVWNVFRGDTAATPGGPAVLRLDLGEYQPLLGRSFTEIAGESRSMHKSQGFGAPERRGPNLNYFQHRLGEPARRDPFEGVETGWSRVQGGAAVDRILAEAERGFDAARPHAILPTLLRAHAEMSRLSGDPWIEIKRGELLEVIRSCAGLWVEAVASKPTASPGGEVQVVAAAIQRSPAALTLEQVEFPFGAAARDRSRPLLANATVADTVTVRLPENAAYSQPYWLARRATKGRFVVDDAASIGHAQNPPALVARLTVGAGDQRLVLEAPVVYRWTDPVAGERYRPFVVVPVVTLGFDEKFYVFPGRAERRVRLRVESQDAPIQGSVRLEAPAGFVVEPAAQPVSLEPGAHAHVEFRVRPGASAAPSSGALRALVSLGGRDAGFGRVAIDHAHIPIQVLFPPAEARFVYAPIERRGDEIGYVMGSGDEGPSALRQMGWRVTLLTDQELDWGDLSRYHTIVTGVRAWNTREPLSGPGPSRLLDYVAKGGTLVVQYSTAERGLGERMAPRRFEIGRDRVTVEEAPVRFDPRHPLLAAPNPITASDFEGWVQERGLYFASAWDSSAFQPVLSSNDPGEPARDGGLLVAPHGDGLFVYAGYAFFRQLPACVPGAYRLFANLVSAEKPRGKGPESRGR
jgi:LmbE family N-acetylglucosaminyl deacetylase